MRDGSGVKCCYICLQYLKEHEQLVYINLLTSGRRSEYFVSVNEQAEDMFFMCEESSGKGDNLYFIKVFDFIIVLTKATPVSYFKKDNDVAF